jgi:histidine triad (HIT) family protein
VVHERSECVFCQIVAGEAEASLVNETERAVAFMDIQPITVGHVLVVPRRHASSLEELEDEDGSELFKVGQRAGAALRGSSLRCEGVNFFLADGTAAGQDVFHVHLHVFPRFEEDGFGLHLPDDFVIRPREELEAAASALRAAWPVK